MAGDEDEAQEIVADLVVERRVEVGLRGRLELPAELLVLAGEERRPAELVDRPVLGRGHQPGSRTLRDARPRPPLERGDEGVLGQVLGQADVPHEPREAGDQPGRLDPPDRLDRAMGVGGQPVSAPRPPRPGSAPRPPGARA